MSALRTNLPFQNICSPSALKNLVPLMETVEIEYTEEISERREIIQTKGVETIIDTTKDDKKNKKSKNIKDQSTKRK